MVRTTPSISTFLWFERNAEAAAEFYTTLFPNSRITKIARWGDGGPAPKGSVMTVAFELAGHTLTAINGGPHYKLTPAVSLVVSCETQAEIDHYWDKLLEGGQVIECGWLTDKYGVSWQIVPNILLDMISSTDRAAARRATEAMLKMKKLDIAELKQAFSARRTAPAMA